MVGLTVSEALLQEDLTVDGAQGRKYGQNHGGQSHFDWMCVVFEELLERLTLLGGLLRFDTKETRPTANNCDTRMLQDRQKILSICTISVVPCLCVRLCACASVSIEPVGRIEDPRAQLAVTFSSTACNAYGLVNVCRHSFAGYRCGCDTIGDRAGWLTAMGASGTAFAGG